MLVEAAKTMTKHRAIERSMVRMGKLLPKRPQLQYDKPPETGGSVTADETGRVMIAISAETIESFPSLRKAGLYHRRMTEGHEKELVEAFVRSKLAPARSGQVRLVFIEPRLDTGFPDVVIVYLDSAVASEWSSRRASLRKQDICVLHHLATCRSEDQARLSFLFPVGLRSALCRLESMDLVRCAQGRWYAQKPRKLMAVRRIVAIEAKIGAWRRGLEQAFLNRWFASESYLLLPSVPKSADLENELGQTGVGLLTHDTPMRRPAIRADKTKLPGSYASWLFNEWACHACVASTTLATHVEA